MDSLVSASNDDDNFFAQYGSKIIGLPALNGAICAKGDVHTLIYTFNRLTCGNYQYGPSCISPLSIGEDIWLEDLYNKIDKDHKLGKKDYIAEISSKKNGISLKDIKKKADSGSATGFLFGYDWINSEFKGFKLDLNNGVLSKRPLDSKNINDCIHVSPGGDSRESKNEILKLYNKLTVKSANVNYKKMENLARAQRQRCFNDRQKDEFGGCLITFTLTCNNSNTPNTMIHYVNDNKWSPS